MTDINYRNLLIKYIEHLREIESVDYIEFYDRGEEWQALKECSEWRSEVK